MDDPRTCNLRIETTVEFSCEVTHAAMPRKMGGNRACGRVLCPGCPLIYVGFKCLHCDIAVIFFPNSQIFIHKCISYSEKNEACVTRWCDNATVGHPWAHITFYCHASTLLPPKWYVHISESPDGFLKVNGYADYVLLLPLLQKEPLHPLSLHYLCHFLKMLSLYH